MSKRLCDICLAMIGLLLFAPIILVIALAVERSMGRPILFRQIRIGLNGREFELRKFRSMIEAFDQSGGLLPDHERVTRVGNFLRRSRLDELPELWLVLRGDMSFVGPRPLPYAALGEAGPLHHRARLRPGLTGLAQVSGNTKLATDEKFALDLLYVDTRSLLGDLAIIARTVSTVVAGEQRDERTISKAMKHAQYFDRSRQQHSHYAPGDA